MDNVYWYVLYAGDSYVYTDQYTLTTLVMLVFVAHLFNSSLYFNYPLSEEIKIFH